MGGDFSDWTILMPVDEGEIGEEEAWDETKPKANEGRGGSKVGPGEGIELSNMNGRGR